MAVSGEGPPLLALHGFTGSVATWDPFHDSWLGFRLITVDLLGHGASDSPGDPERYSMARCLQDLLALLDYLGAGRAGLLGYSMGGRIALRLALAAPERFGALVLESASPGIEDAAERQERVKSDKALADSIKRQGIAAFVERWEALPLFRSQAGLPKTLQEALRRQRLANNAVGLANSLRGIGAGMQPAVFDQLPGLGVPTLLLAGALDARYCELAERMAKMIPCARLQIVPEAGHATHLEQPETFSRLVKGFLEDRPRPATSTSSASGPEDCLARPLQLPSGRASPTASESTPLIPFDEIRGRSTG